MVLLSLPLYKGQTITKLADNGGSEASPGEQGSPNSRKGFRALCAISLLLRLCAFLCWKRRISGVAQYSKCRLVGSVEKKWKKESERDGRNCRGLWYMKQCRIWNRLGSVLGKKRRKLDGKSGFGAYGMFKWFRNMSNTIQNIKTKDFKWE